MQIEIVYNSDLRQTFKVHTKDNLKKKMNEMIFGQCFSMACLLSNGDLTTKPKKVDCVYLKYYYLQRLY